MVGEITDQLDIKKIYYFFIYVLFFQEMLEKIPDKLFMHNASAQMTSHHPPPSNPSSSLAEPSSVAAWACHEFGSGVRVARAGSWGCDFFLSVLELFLKAVGS